MKFYTAIVLPLLSILEPPDRRKVLPIILLIVFSALLDFFSLASFLPLLFLVVNPDWIADHPFAEQLPLPLDLASANKIVLLLTATIFFFVITKNLLSRWIVTKKTSFAFGLSSNLASRAMVQYLEKTYLNFSAGDFTRELNRIVNYPFAFANNMILPLLTLMSEVVVTGLILTGIAIYDWKVLLLILAILIPVALLYKIRRQRLKDISISLREKYPMVLKYALQVIEGFSEIKSSQTETFFHRRFHTLSNDITKIFAKDQLIQSGTVRLTEIIVGVLICSLIVYSILFQQNYQQTLMLLGVYAGASFRVIPSLNRILHSSQQVRMHEHLLEELGSLKNYHRSEPLYSVATSTFSEKIELRNISFSYAMGNPILKNIFLSIRKGEKVAITGRSGEGKTTLLLIILRFLNESSGEILIDNKILDSDVAWRKLIGYVPQSPYILDGTIAENIAFGIPADKMNRDKIDRIISDLDLDEMVRESQDGIDTMVGERGVKLSGGQRQRIAIARALYGDTEILLLDEITNQVHSFMEEEILRILDRLSAEKKTIIMVTHKITKAGFFDCVYKLDNRTLHQVKIQPFV